jgi:cell division protein FtsB
MGSKLAWVGLSALILYFAFHAFAGDKGLGAWSDIQHRVEVLEARKAELAAEKARLEALLVRLDPANPDPDTIATLARERLGYVLPGEIVMVVR